MNGYRRYYLGEVGQIEPLWGAHYEGGEKYCTGCGEFKPLDCFPSLSASGAKRCARLATGDGDGLSTKCRVCVNAYHREYRRNKNG